MKISCLNPCNKKRVLFNTSAISGLRARLVWCLTLHEYAYAGKDMLLKSRCPVTEKQVGKLSPCSKMTLHYILEAWHQNPDISTQDIIQIKDFAAIHNFTMMSVLETSFQSDGGGRSVCI